jgi:hypothetical protein
MEEFSEQLNQPVVCLAVAGGCMDRDKKVVISSAQHDFPFCAWFDCDPKRSRHGNHHALQAPIKL